LKKRISSFTFCKRIGQNTKEILEFQFKRNDKEEQLANLPSYARVEDEFPDWKQRYIRQNRQFYKDNKKFIEDVVKQISNYLLKVGKS
jgi:hypothetical protein